MTAASIPLPPQVHDQLASLFKQAIDLLAPYQIALTDKEQKSLGSVNMGPASVSFAQDAGQLLTQYTQVLRRSITDDVIAAYPVLLDTFSAASDLEVQVNTLRAQLDSIGLVAGASVMSTARAAYQDGQNDKGRTPGVADLVARMSARFPHTPTVAPAPVPAR